MHPVMLATYRVRGDAHSIEDRARAIAVEQSVEMPVAAIDDTFVLDEIVGRVETIAEIRQGLFEVRIQFAGATAGGDAGQLINILFGNTSLHDDVVLHDVDLPDALMSRFGGPRHGLECLRRRVGAGLRALTCSALKPQGLSAEKLAGLAARFGEGGIDYIKDDHGLADQSYSPFADRVGAVTKALRRVESATGRAARYAPSLSGDLDAMRRQLAFAADVGVDTALVAPMVTGLANFHRLVLEHPGVAFMTHPSMAGAARLAPPLLFGKLFRMLGADAVIFPNHGGRFGYSVETCRDIARVARRGLGGLNPSVPVPAGGMTTDRITELLEFYGPDTMLLIGGGLLTAGDNLVQETAAFVAAVRSHRYG
jgi:ribulose-bisphosphate carboxylase large chain